MRLLVDARVGWGQGIGRVNANILPRLAAIRPDWQIEVLVMSADLQRARSALGQAGNLDVVGVDVEPFSLREQRLLARHAEGCDLTWFTNYWVPLAWSGPFVVTVHDVLHLIPELLPTSRLNRVLARLTFAKVRRQAAAIHFVSRFTEREFARRVGPVRRARVLPLGSDHLPEAGEGTAATGVRQPRLLVVAAAKAHKNFAMLIQAWAAAKVDPAWRLTVVSPAVALRSSIDLERLAASDPRVDLIRGASDAALAALYRDSAILLTPSLYEGFGLPLLEGMAAGTWCISADAGAMIEVAQGGIVQFVGGDDHEGWVRAIEQGCGLAATAPDLLEQARRRNVLHAASFTWQSTAHGMAALLEEAVKPASSEQERVATVRPRP